MSTTQHDDVACFAEKHTYQIISTYYPTPQGRPTADDRRKAHDGAFGCCLPRKAKGRARLFAAELLKPGMSVEFSAWRPSGRLLLSETIHHPTPVFDGESAA